ncbi:hypothetical protein F4801DRAFT_107411 [Xylaria longipes]|nr:hypothetical protein F4801DRAFT_107411 [Xylaria longipes]
MGCTSNIQWLQVTCFATPTIVFCSGFCIGTIIKTGQIILTSTDETDDVYNLDDLATILAEVISSLEVMSIGLGLFSKFLRTADLHDRVVDFLTLKIQDSMERLTRPGTEVYIQQRKEISGKYYFITDTGLLGLAARQPQIDDMVALVYTSPVYYVLREVNREGSKLPDVEEHQMVAQAYVNATPDEMKVFFDGDSVHFRSFQIV